jgi:hypothetical protein
VLEGVPRQPPKAKNDSGVLNETVRIEELRSDRADAIAGHLRDHLAQPISVRHLDVVVQQTEEIAA